MARRGKSDGELSDLAQEIAAWADSAERAGEGVFADAQRTGLPPWVDFVLRAAPPMAVHWGEAGRTVYNAAYARLAGARHPDLLGAELARWPQMAELHARARLEGGLYAQALAAREAAEEAGPWLEVSLCPIPNGEGRVAGFLGLLSDRTRQVRAERERNRSRTEARVLVEEATRPLEAAIARLKEEMGERHKAEDALRHRQKLEALGQLTGGIAHDFNNLLTGIVGSLDLARRRLEAGKSADIARFLDLAMTSANRAAALTSRLLTFSRRRPLDPQVIDVNQLIASLEDLLRRTITEKITFEVAMAAQLPSVRCDANQLDSALLNLAINARDAMADGGRFRIETRLVEVTSEDASRWATPPGLHVRISVSDTGAGMAPETLARAFDPFFTTKPLGVGTGLGLAMVHSLAQQSGGGAWIESAPGVGTTVHLLLPASGDAVAAATDSQSTGFAKLDGAGRVVLVVEDEQSVRAFVAEVLQAQGFRPIAATDGTSALEILYGDARIDLLVTDIGLPGLDGLQLVEAARQHRPDLRVLFMTAYAPALDETTERVMRKPFTVDRLLAEVRRSFDETFPG